MSKHLTKRANDYSKWYNELVIKADLAENSAVRGCMVIKPYGYAIWEKMQAELDRMFKETGVQRNRRCSGVSAAEATPSASWSASASAA